MSFFINKFDVFDAQNNQNFDIFEPDLSASK